MLFCARITNRSRIVKVGLLVGLAQVVMLACTLLLGAPLSEIELTGAFQSLAWGLGHGIGVCIIGGIGLALRGLVDVEAWSGWAGFLVTGSPAASSR